MNRTTSRLTLGLAVGLLAVVSVQAGSLEPPPGPVSPTRPPDTCYDNTGNRFVDCGDGTIKDTETGLYWLKNVQCFGYQSWAAANITAAELAHGQCGLTDGSLPGDWRLPTLECPSGSSCTLPDATGEFASIFAPSCAPSFILDTTGTGCWAEGDPFTGVESFRYWSATTYASLPLSAWSAVLELGFTNAGFKPNEFIVWPVRGEP